MRPAVVQRLPLLLAGLLLVTQVQADDTPLPPEEAAAHVGETRTVEFVVRATGKSRKEKLIFLNSLANYRDLKNFAVVLDAAMVDKLAKEGISDVEQHYFGKVIQATGTIRHYKNLTDMKVDDPQQLKIIGDTPPLDAAVEEDGAIQPMMPYVIIGGIVLFVLGLLIGRWTAAAPL